MAKKHSKGSAPKAIRTKDVLQAISQAQDSLYAMEELAQSAAQMKTLFGFCMSVQALANKASQAFGKAIDMLPPKHEAVEHLVMAAGELQKVDVLAEMVDSSSEGQSVKQTHIFLETVGTTILNLVSTAGRWMERAELSLEQSGYCGWLNSLANVDAVPKEWELTRSREESNLVLNFRQLGEAERAQIERLVADLRANLARRAA